MKRQFPLLAALAAMFLALPAVAAEQPQKGQSTVTYGPGIARPRSASGITVAR